MNPLVLLFSQYELFEQTANHLSTIDLYHAALACSDLHVLIRKPENTFKRLKRVALCDGYGLQARQSFSGPFNGLTGLGVANWPSNPSRKEVGVYPCYAKEEVEIRVWNLKCDETNALPCLKCSLNVCERCRYVPRVYGRDRQDPSRRPHLDWSGEAVNLIVYCAECDPAVEERTEGRYCNCDRYTRWICLRCHNKEDEESSWYQRHRTKTDEYGGTSTNDLVVQENEQERSARA